LGSVTIHSVTVHSVTEGTQVTVTNLFKTKKTTVFREIKMLSNSWNKTEGESISQKVLGKVKPDEPLKNRIDFAQRKLQTQISKLSGINEKLRIKHDKIFEKIVNAQRNNKSAYAQAYAGELTQVRKMKNMVSGAKLSMEQVKLRLDTVSELGDVVVTLSPCMSIIKGLSPALSGIMPEANASMQDLSQILGDVMSGSSVGMQENFSTGVETNEDTLAILEEAHNVIAGQTKSSIPEVPSGLRQQVTERKSDIFI
jgi:division protein CdvB (Snf7/Vps24/ESCRT-III family)